MNELIKVLIVLAMIAIIVVGSLTLMALFGAVVGGILSMPWGFLVGFSIAFLYAAVTER